MAFLAFNSTIANGSTSSVSLNALDPNSSENVPVPAREAAVFVTTDQTVTATPGIHINTLSAQGRYDLFKADASGVQSYALTAGNHALGFRVQPGSRAKLAIANASGSTANVTVRVAWGEVFRNAP